MPILLSFFFFFNKVISLTYSFGRSGTCYIVQASPKMTAVGLLLGIGITRVPPSLTCICIFLLKFLLHRFSFWLGQQPFPPDSSTLLSYSNPRSSFSQAHSVWAWCSSCSFRLSLRPAVIRSSTRPSGGGMLSFFKGQGQCSCFCRLIQVLPSLPDLALIWLAHDTPLGSPA